MIRKTAVIGGPGSGKSTLLASDAIQPGAVSLDPTGGLLRKVRGAVEVARYDRHGAGNFAELTDWLQRRMAKDTPVLIDFSHARPDDREEASNELGFWLVQHMRGGIVVVDEVQWFLDSANRKHGLIELVGKCRNNGTAVTISTHRPTLMNKSILGMSDTVRVGRLIDPRDLEAAAKLLSSKVSTRELDELAAVLPTLQPGYWVTLEAAEPGGN